MKPLSLLLATAILASAPVSAHDFWIEPLDFEIAAGESAAVHLRVGENFHGKPLLPPAASILGFQAHDRAGARPVRTATFGAVPNIVAAPHAGLLAIAYESRPAAITLGPSSFEQYLREEGLEHVVARRAVLGDSALPGRELFARSAKTLIRVEGESSDPEALAPLGLPLEFVTDTNPYSLSADAPLELELLYRGEPAADVLVVALPKADPASAQRGRTDASGRVTITLGRPGAWLVKAVRMDAAPQDSEADWMSWWASLTFAIPEG